jgi:hypothetical protein
VVGVGLVGVHTLGTSLDNSCGGLRRMLYQDQVIGTPLWVVFTMLQPVDEAVGVVVVCQILDHSSECENSVISTCA